MIKLKRTSIKRPITKTEVANGLRITEVVDNFDDFYDDDEEDSFDEADDDFEDEEDEESIDPFTQRILNAPVVPMPTTEETNKYYTDEEFDYDKNDEISFISDQITLLEEGLNTLNEDDIDDVYNISLVINNLKQRLEEINA